jgi:hypothetical protein
LSRTQTRVQVVLLRAIFIAVIKYIGLPAKVLLRLLFMAYLTAPSMAETP